MNMHKHLHLEECVEHFGPIYSFWCFPCDRFNGRFKSDHTNNRTVETQIAKKFMREQCVSIMTKQLEHPKVYSEVDRSTFKNILFLQDCNLPLPTYKYNINHNSCGISTHQARGRETSNILDTLSKEFFKIPIKECTWESLVPSLLF